MDTAASVVDRADQAHHPANPPVNPPVTAVHDFRWIASEENW
jgi:hypothetical protein